MGFITYHNTGSTHPHWVLSSTNSVEILSEAIFLAGANGYWFNESNGMGMLFCVNSINQFIAWLYLAMAFH
jgi:hypothetical protein